MKQKGVLIQYQESYRMDWERFVEEESLNGTFFHTRNFLDYHPQGKFKDHSLLFLKGNNIVAAIPANIEMSEDGKKLVSHLGSTFGGIVLGKQYNKISDVMSIFEAMEDYFKENEFGEVLLRQTSELYADANVKILEYFFQLYKFTPICEMGYFGELKEYDVNIIESFHASRRRGYRIALEYNLIFRQLHSDEEIKEFYLVLCNNMGKFGVSPTHSLEELLDFKNCRLKDDVRFYGVYYEGKMIAGSMVYCIKKKVFHTHYLAALLKMLHTHSSEFMYENLIYAAKKEGFEQIAFGNCTLEGGKKLHETLARFKEGFGTQVYMNKFYTKVYEYNKKSKKSIVNKVFI